MHSSTSRGSRPRSLDLVAVLLPLAALTLAGCGGVAGTYESRSEATGGQVVITTLELSRDGKARLTVRGGPRDTPLLFVEGTYAVEADRITTELDGNRDVYTREGDTLTTEAFGGEAVVLLKL